MEDLVAKQPADTEAKIFYAIALTASAPPTDKTYANLAQTTPWPFARDQVAGQRPHMLVENFWTMGSGLKWCEYEHCAAVDPLRLMYGSARSDNFSYVVNKPVIVQLSYKDVIHSFKVIAMRVTQDAIPGMRIQLHFTPTKVGTYQINCAQLCGQGHANMSVGYLEVDTQEDFDKWMAAQTPTAPGGNSFE